MVKKCPTCPEKKKQLNFGKYIDFRGNDPILSGRRHEIINMELAQLDDKKKVVIRVQQPTQSTKPGYMSQERTFILEQFENSQLHYLFAYLRSAKSRSNSDQRDKELVQIEELLNEFDNNVNVTDEVSMQ